jgi:hypothetical protein
MAGKPFGAERAVASARFYFKEVRKDDAEIRTKQADF